MLTLVESSDSLPRETRSQTSLAYERIRRDLLSGRHAPGERLKITDLATALDVSPGAVREALSRLVPEQLVVSRDQKGFVVAPLSVQDLEDLTDLRCEMEAIALRRSVALGDEGWEAAVLASAHRLRRSRMMSEDGSLSAEWVERHAAFHAALVSACGNRRLLDLLSQLYQQSERYRGLSIYVEGERDIPAEHQALVDAALDRNAERLVELMYAHLRTTTSMIVSASRSSAAALA